MSQKTEKDPKKLRSGFTTGACATAATRAAMEALVTGRELTEVETILPVGKRITFKLAECRLDPDGKSAFAAVIKDAGDDPDVTHGAKICATVSWSDRPGIEIDRGEGVGMITKPGLGLPVGTPAINPVPRKTITETVMEITGGIPSKRGVRIVISVPGGEEMAKKTENDRLGIIGGISILGTTGIVVPFSTAAYKMSIVQAIDVARAQGIKTIVLTTGGQSEKFTMAALADRSLPPEAFVQMGDFCGFSLRQCANKGVERVIVGGLIGKLSKIAAGVFQTHAAGSSVDLGFLAGFAKECGASSSLLAEIKSANTAREFSEIVIRNQVKGVFDAICGALCAQASRHVKGVFAVEALIVGFSGEQLGHAILER